MPDALPEVQGAVHICGGGWSLEPKKLRGRKNVCTVNQAHDYLIEHGVVPRWCVLVDPAPELAHTVTPHERVEYLVASQCDPAVFDKLDGFSVRVFHIANSVPIDDLVRSPLRVAGGTGAVHRAFAVLWHCGGSVFHFWGFDCCGDHAYVHRVNEGEARQPVQIGDRTWMTTQALLAQARSFFQQLQDMNAIRPPRVIVHGDGLVAALRRQYGH